MKCAACGLGFGTGDYDSLAGHFTRLASRNDVTHVMWLNRYITKQKQDVPELSKLLSDYFDLTGTTLQKWIRERFAQKFYGVKPHPFVLSLQHPSKATLLGYVVEHQHFLRQWVRSCSYIVAKTTEADVTLYELDNINTEYFGGVKPSHYELLLRMGESLGVDRKEVLALAPLPDTENAIKSWDQIARESHWVETMAAMHGLELIADRTLVEDGAKLTYFSPTILEKNDEVTQETKDFLREGYEADATHSKEALDLVEKYASALGLVEDVQAVFVRSMDLFHSYLLARLERGEMYKR